MPANLPPQYQKLEQRFREVKSIPEKIACLEEMLATIPKHKGTEKLQKEIKTKIAKFRKQTGKKSQASRHGQIYTIPREGAGQVILLGHDSALAQIARQHGGRDAPLEIPAGAPVKAGRDQLEFAGIDHDVPVLDLLVAMPARALAHLPTSRLLEEHWRGDVLPRHVDDVRMMR